MSEWIEKAELAMKRAEHATQYYKITMAYIEAIACLLMYMVTKEASPEDKGE